MGGEVGGECMGMGRGGGKDEKTYREKMGEMNKLPPPRQMRADGDFTTRYLQSSGEKV